MVAAKRIVPSLITAMAVLMTCTGQEVRAADPPSSEDKAAPPWSYDANATYHEDDIAARMKGEGITRDAAIHRFRVEDAAAMLGTRVPNRWPDTFAGLWITHDPEPFGITVSFTGDAAERVEELRSEFPFPDDLHPAQGEVSAAEMNALMDRMIADRISIADGHPRAGLPPAMKETKGAYDLSIDTKSGIIDAQAEGAPEQLAAAFHSAYGTSRIRVGLGRSRPNCAQLNCLYAMMGGLQLTNNVDGGCSTAFTAFTPTKRYVLSAAHCAGYPDTDVQRYHAGALYGRTTGSSWHDSVDVERIAKTNPSFNESSKFWVADSNPRMVHSFMEWSAMPASGTYVAKSGFASGTTRGYTQTKSYAPSGGGYPANSRNYVLVDFCSSGGDSGGSVFAQNTAWGLVSGGVSGSIVTHRCRDINGVAQGANEWTFFTAISAALTDQGVSLLTGVNLAPSADFTATCSLTTCDFVGYGSDDDGSITTHTWNWGDGTATTRSGSPMDYYSIRHTYTLPGQYAVTLTVTDNDAGTGSAVHTILAL
jgi:hypothetical protein